jgi:hypothetical protein
MRRSPLRADRSQSAGVTAAIPANYTFAGAPAPQLPDREPSAPILTAVLACFVSVTPNTSAASAAIACIRPEVFSRIVATFRATPGGSTLVNHTAFSSGSLRRDRRTEAWNAIRDLAAASPEIARCAITMSNARPRPTCRPKIRWQRCSPRSSATSSFAVSKTTVLDGSSWEKARAYDRPRRAPTPTHPFHPVLRLALCGGPSRLPRQLHDEACPLSAARRRRALPPEPQVPAAPPAAVPLPGALRSPPPPVLEIATVSGRGHRSPTRVVETGAGHDG